jgi:hypothetical protein
VSTFFLKSLTLSLLEPLLKRELLVVVVVLRLFLALKVKESSVNYVASPVLEVDKSPLFIYTKLIYFINFNKMDPNPF